jgi:hypothetical protein
VDHGLDLELIELLRVRACSLVIGVSSRRAWSALAHCTRLGLTRGEEHRPGFAMPWQASGHARMVGTPDWFPAKPVTALTGQGGMAGRGMAGQ